MLAVGIGLVLTKKVIPMFRNNQLQYAREIAIIACKAAEQLWKSGAIQKSERYKTAEKYVKENLKLSDNDVRMLVEATVNEFKGDTWEKYAKSVETKVD